MDIVHHTLIGGSGYLIASAFDQHLAGAAFLMGSVFPDLDVFFMIFGKRFYLRNHQGITHSLLLAPFYALLICLPLLYLPGVSWDWLLFGLALSGLVLHVSLDWFNTFKIALLSPFVSNRYSMDAVFFVDGIALLLTGLFYGFYGYFGIDFVAYVYPMLFLGYFLFKLWLHDKVVGQLKPLFVIPSSLNPFEFYILVRDDGGLSGYVYNALGKTKKDELSYPSISKKYTKLAEQSQVFRDMQHITRAFYITKVVETDDGIVIYAGDLAVRNYGGKFAKTILKFDRHDRLVSEMANI
jgi:membrane-bound metal-dependent hydrolase YbcI (DUF457 family)